ncbi:MAG TPA: hypothetical protein VNV37_07740 [Solirubrobacteraceae bacterium]|jgi:hypothetical protein|nr:hypothetical protein [Solirubrobacteraceae bacterium]
MAALSSLETTLLPGARELLAFHAHELPQRDDLCGAFCGALALHAAGVERRAGEPLDQDAVALAAGSVVAASDDPAHLPCGERGRRDYRLALPFVQDAAVSGTTAAGVRDAIEQLSGGALAAIPYSGPWTAATLDGLFELAAACEKPVTLIANLATRHLWGGRAGLNQLLDHLYTGASAGPPPDWEVGHFVCVFARVRGPHGALYGVADTYPALGWGGVHAQPSACLAAAIARRDRSRETRASGADRFEDAREASVAPIGPRFSQPAGGVLAVVAAADAADARAGATAVGLREELWDNGTVTVGAAA